MDKDIRKDKDKLVCKIAKDICSDSISTFDELVSKVSKTYGDEGINVIAMKTTFFKELIDSNYKKITS
jgi:hypothetical protein